MQIVTTWNKQASVVKNTDIIITNYALIKQKKAKITCLCDFCFLLFFCFLFFSCLQSGADWEAISKTRASCFTGVSKHSKTIKWKPRQNTRTRFWNITSSSKRPCSHQRLPFINYYLISPSCRYIIFGNRFSCSLLRVSFSNKRYTCWQVPLQAVLKTQLS